MRKKFYSLRAILSKGAQYNVIFGGRSDGKTYAVLKYGIEQFINDGSQLAIVRRWQTDYIGKRGAAMFDGIVSNGVISKLTRGEWTSVYYYSSRWYLCRYEENGDRVTHETPFAYGFAISSMEHDKSTSYPNVRTICFDEFISRNAYLPDEFILFMNTISTIIRQRTDVKIFMLGNTVNKYCPYFEEMGLKYVRSMKEGEIVTYRYGDSKLLVAVEYCKHNKEGKPSDMFFAFDNPKLSMITGGAWEIDIYPHCPVKYVPNDVLFTYYIVFSGDVLQCEVVGKDDRLFTFIHQKTSPLDYDRDFIYTTEYDARPNVRRNITTPRTPLEKRITEFFLIDKVFYASNEVGEIVRNYLIWCKK